MRRFAFCCATTALWDASATDFMPGANALGDSIEEPWVLVRFRRTAAASRIPPLLLCQDSVWSRTAKIGRPPSRESPAEVAYSILVRQPAMNVSMTSRP